LAHKLDTMRLVPLTFLCALALVGLGGGAAAAAEPSSVGEFKLAYKRTGGVAGSTQTLAVRPGRKATATAGAIPSERTRAEFRLTARRIRSLQGALARADIGSIPPPGPSGCADCFLYDLRYEGHHVELEEVDVPERLRPVFDQLDAIIAAHTVTPSARVVAAG
jgi:hypothetical protein